MTETTALQARGKQVALSLELLAIVDRIRERIARTYYETEKDLAEAKALCGHGQWLPFLEAVGLGERSAQRMMKTAKLIDENPDKYDNLSGLPIMQTLFADYPAPP